ncbi:MAG TPA: YCF48-related protein [Saprospiraceae bacterium]|nr:YCF48-related protein [Saprospiraceae bacterium]
MKNLLLAAFLAQNISLLAQGQWQLVQQHPTGFNGVYGLDAQNLWLSGGSGEFFRSSNGGAQLQLFKIPDSYSFMGDIAVRNDGTVLFGGGCYFPFDQCPGNFVLHTDADGADWQFDMLDTFQFAIGVVGYFDSHPDGRVYAVSDYGGIYYSPGPGEDWSPIPVLPPYSINVYSSVQFTDQQTGYVLGSKYIQANDYAFRLLKTIDGGQTWDINLEIAVDDIGSQRVFQFTDASTGFVPGDSGILYKTTDGGQNWTEQQVAASGDDLYRVQFAGNQTGYLFTSNYNLSQSKIYRTTDGGQNWSLDFQVDSTYFSDAHFYNPNSGFAVTPDGKIFARTASNATHENADYQPVAVFPNPAENAFQVNFELSGNLAARFSLYDVQGRLVLEQTLTQSKETIHCGELPAGTYFYTLTQEENGCVGRGKIMLK